jgi:hypothetical protein
MNMNNNDVRIALLDMNNNHPNQGMRNIKELSKAFQEQSNDNVSVEIFDVRYKNEMPDIADFDIFISSGGPGNPHREGYEWEQKYADFLDQIWKHNLQNNHLSFLPTGGDPFWNCQRLQEKIIFLWRDACP